MLFDCYVMETFHKMLELVCFVSNEYSSCPCNAKRLCLTCNARRREYHHIDEGYIPSQ
jgi:hypothetical protein